MNSSGVCAGDGYWKKLLEYFDAAPSALDLESAVVIYIPFFPRLLIMGNDLRLSAEVIIADIGS